jgi:hypothetical protein
MKATIEAPNDANKTPYAVAFSRGLQYGGAELRMVLKRLFASRYSHELLTLEAHAYVSPDMTGVYGLRLLSDDRGHQELDALLVMSKEMQRIDKRLKAMDDELGYVKGPNAYPEFCRRVCIAAGVSFVFVEHGYETGLRNKQGQTVRSVWDLRCYDPKKNGASFLFAMQDLTDATLKARGKMPENVEA